MPSFSQVSVMGYIGNDVSLKSGRKANYLNLAISVTRAYKPNPEENKWVQKTRWIKVMFYGPYAQYAVDRVNKGDLVHITGELEVQEKMKDGQKQYDMYVMGKYLIPIIRRNRDKTDDNYGVPEDEIEAPFT